MSNSKFSAVFFDLDGTLFDTARDLIPAVLASVKLAKLPQVDKAEEKILSAVAFGSRAMIKAACSEITEEELDRATDLLHEIYAETAGEKSEFYEHIPELLDELLTDKIPFGIVTDKNTRFTEKLLQRKNIDRRLICIICGDSLNVRKPDAQVLLYAAAHCNVLPETAVYLGDSEKDLQTAKAANMPFIRCLWGYGKFSECTECKNIFTAPTPAALHNLLFY
ncbi:MAG: HAD-IA family hydrolase [Cardiobacteriaceae bacterium]|nr:HAD-IA family hydrolase [Cardiobacteriaceae bacterium]